MDAVNPDKLDGGLTYKENAWFNALKTLSKNQITKLFTQHRKEIKDIIINTGEEKTEGILPVELPEVFFKILQYSDCKPTMMKGKDNNTLEQNIQFKTYTEITKKSKTFVQDLIAFSEKLIELSGGGAGNSPGDDVEEEEAEEELEVDTDG